jgi:hypothetical protein
MKKGRASKKSARARSTDTATEEPEVAAYCWNVNYLKECEEQTRDLRDKAYFLGLNNLAGLLESVRTESKTVLTMLVLASPASGGKIQ